MTIVIEDDGSARLRRVEHNLRSVRGMIPTPPGPVTDDFDDLIDEAMTDHADARMRRMRETSR